MIKKEIKTGGVFGGNYSDEISYPQLPELFIEISEEQRDYIDANIDKLIYDEAQDGIFENPKGIVDISETQAYKDKTAALNKELKVVQLASEVEQLDKKRIRAIAEPQLKDAATGETWLEYYTQQIVELRNQIAAL